MRNLKYYNMRKSSYWIVYGLPYEMYCGQTQQPFTRMYKHKALGKDTDDWFILAVCRSKAESIRVESYYHQKGWKGSRAGHNKGHHNASKKVLNTKTGEIYNSIKEAAKAINRDHSTLSKKLRGKRKNNTNLILINKQ